MHLSLSKWKTRVEYLVDIRMLKPMEKKESEKRKIIIN